MTRKECVVVAASLLISGIAHQASATVTVSPAHPTTADSVAVVVSNSFVDLCWHVDATQCQVAGPETLAVIVGVQYCSGAPSCNCNQFPFSYTRGCDFGRLPAGAYVAVFTELHVNSFDPRPTVTQTQAFTVEAATPALHRSWGRLKSIYR